MRIANPAGLIISERFFVPVARFASLRTDVSLQDLRELWTGSAVNKDRARLYPDSASLADLMYLLGKPGPAVMPLPANQIAGALWNDPQGLGLLPFDALTPRLRALSVDHLSLTDNHLDPARWPLVRRRSIRAPVPAQAGDEPTRRPETPVFTNRNPDRLTVLVMTGVTAMARGTAAAIELHNDSAWPARQVGPELARADLTVISNEIPFVDGCVADNRVNVLVLCSSPSYFAALELSGVKLVGLTGNHLNDFGWANLLKTLDLYEQHKVRTYAGGRNEAEAQAPLIVQDHGNTLAFLGANSVGPEAYWAGAETPGGARFDRATMAGQIAALKKQGALVFAELQYWETDAEGDYSVNPTAAQREDFQALADAGADVMTGVQAHAPQAVELRGPGIVLYGLGNLYFDQTWSWPTRTGLVARHTIYNGRLLNTELLVTVIQDDMQLRWATPQERAEVLQTVFKASGW